MAWNLPWNQTMVVKVCQVEKQRIGWHLVQVRLAPGKTMLQVPTTCAVVYQILILHVMQEKVLVVGIIHVKELNI